MKMIFGLEKMRMGKEIHGIYCLMVQLSVIPLKVQLIY
jgi:hypothetical protein